MEASKTPEEFQERRRSIWSRRFAIGFCAIASILGWAAIAGLFVGVWSDGGPQIADEKGVEALSDIAPAAGPAAPESTAPASTDIKPTDGTPKTTKP